MHELSIAMSIVDIAQQEAERLQGARVTAIHLRIGSLAGVAREALLASYEMVRENTALAEARLVVEEVPGVIYCKVCQARRDVISAEWFRCSGCGSIASELVQGKELQFTSLEVEE